MATRGNRPGGSDRSARPGTPSRSSKNSGSTRRKTAADGRFPARLRGQRITWLIVNVVLAVALLGSAVGAGVFGYQAWHRYQVQQAHQEAQAAARQVVVDFLTISAASVSKDIKSVLDGSTGEFHKQYEEGVPQVRAAIIENKVASTGKVLRSGVVSGDIDSAKVIVAVDANIKNRHSPEGRKAHYRVQVDMVHDADRDRWLVSRLEFVG